MLKILFKDILFDGILDGIFSGLRRIGAEIISQELREKGILK